MSTAIRRLLELLPDEGPGSKRAFALFCVERLGRRYAEAVVEECITVLRKRVAKPSSVRTSTLKRVSRAAVNLRVIPYYADVVHASAALVAATAPQLNGHDAYDACAHVAFAALVNTRDVAFTRAFHSAIQAYITERGAQLAELKKLTHTVEFYPGYWIQLDLFERQGWVLLTDADDFISVRHVTDPEVLVALDYFLEKVAPFPEKTVPFWRSFPEPASNLIGFDRLMEFCRVGGLDMERFANLIGELGYDVYKAHIDEGEDAAEAAREEAEQDAEHLIERCHYDAVLEAAASLFEQYALKLLPIEVPPHPNPGRAEDRANLRQYYLRLVPSYFFTVEPKTVWEAAADLVGGDVGPFNDLAEFLEIGPYASARDAVLDNLRFMGGVDTRKIYRRSFDNCVNSL